MKENIIPNIQKQLSEFLYEEEGNISRGKILTVGSLMLIAGIIFADEVYAAHSSHRSHSSHSSHSSHRSHTSHRSHSSHSSSTHYNHASHSNVIPQLTNYQTPQVPPTTPIIK